MIIVKSTETIDLSVNRPVPEPGASTPSLPGGTPSLPGTPGTPPGGSPSFPGGVTPSSPGAGTDTDSLISDYEVFSENNNNHDNTYGNHGNGDVRDSYHGNHDVKRRYSRVSVIDRGGEGGGSARPKIPSWYRKLHHHITTSSAPSGKHRRDDVTSVTSVTSSPRNSLIEEADENLPSIRNIKNRFESGEEPGATESRTTSQSSYSERPAELNQNSEIYREEQGEKDVVHFHQLNSVRSMFESRASVREPIAPAAAPVKRPSKWDKPQGAPPPPVNRREEEGEEEGYTEDEYGRKPVRKMTPPREDIERDVQEYHRSLPDTQPERDPDIIVSGDRTREQEELPPKAVTRSLLAKFKSFEDVTAAPPLPSSPKKTTSGSARRFTTTTTTTTTSSVSSSDEARKGSQLTPDSGVSLADYPGEGGPAPGDGPGFEGDVVRESDRHDTEELPEQGFTKSLLSKWKQMEQSAPAAPQPARAPAPKRSWAYKEQKPAAAVVVRNGGEPREEEAEQEDRDVVRESDNHEEEFLPPPSFTKNMLAKFRNLEQGSDLPSQQAPAPRKFKWEVKEAKPILRHLGTRDIPANVITQNNVTSDYTENYDDNHHHHNDEYRVMNGGDDVMNGGDDVNDHIYDEIPEQEVRHSEVYSEQVGPEEDERPPPAFTKNLLAKFKSMEDVNAPPPIPEIANKIQKEAVTSITVQRKTSYRTSTSEQPQYEQNDDVRYDDMYSNDVDDEGVIDLAEGGEYENVPEYNADVTRESDQYGEEELPERGTTRSLLAKWQSIQTH